jgi:GGDEF domain-containing protein
MAQRDELTLVEARAVHLTDRQTGLPTLVALCTDLRQLLERGVGLALIMLSLDGADGAALPGAQALLLADIVGEGARVSAHGQPYRTAADSFALLLPGLSRVAALQVAERLRLRIERLGAGLTATLAVAGAPEDAAEVGGLIAVCETALIGGVSGRNRVYAAAPVESLPPVTARLADLLIARMVALMELDPCWAY